MSKKLILLNGPISCGKGELVKKLFNMYPEEDFVEESRCKDRLFELTAQFFGIPFQDFWEIYNDREHKELPHPYFPVTFEAAGDLSEYLQSDDIWKGVSGDKVFLSVRSAMIYVSEIICKPTFGKDYFGVCRANHIATSNAKVYVDDSCFGTMDEVQPAVNLLGVDNIMIVRIHGRGDFNNDSRQYFEYKDIPRGMWVREIVNIGTLQDLRYNFEGCVEEFMGGTL